MTGLHRLTGKCTGAGAGKVKALFCRRNCFEIVVEVLDDLLWVFIFYGFEEEFCFFGILAAFFEVEGGVHLGGFIFVRGIFLELDFKIDVFD